jgi:16S rRNA G966 N2-methylase RsmD/predicted DNA-binding protein YlxM (UPF0122 family)
MRTSKTIESEPLLGQSLLFQNLTSDGLSIEEVAKELNVSSASVRNWIKTGYLVVSKGNVIDAMSFKRFKDEVVGTEKLTKRANKSQLDKHDHLAVQKHLADSTGTFDDVSVEDLGDVYEQSLSNSYRNIEGIYYTPQDIAASFFDTITFDVRDKVFLDPCCGSGNFLIEALKFGFLPENIHGFDIDPVAVEISRRRLFDIVGEDSAKLSCLDFLREVRTSRDAKKYDVIFTNPPWGKKLEKKDKENLAGGLGVHKNTDTSGLFLTSCLDIVRDQGLVGMLMPEAFFNIASFQSVREKALSFDIVQMTDYGKPFKGIISGAKGIIIRKSNEGEGYVNCFAGGHNFIRSKSTFLSNPKLILNLNCDDNAAAVIEFVKAKHHIDLSGNADWGIGIVTGNNAKFARANPEPGYIAAFKGSEIFTDRLAEPSMFIPDDLSAYQQVAPARLYQADEKLIYRFISSKLIFYHDTMKNYVLNSANILIPKDSFPVKPSILAKYLSSDFVNWYFQKVFATHKVLRADLESIPIFAEILSGMDVFDERLMLDRLGLSKYGENYIIT